MTVVQNRRLMLFFRLVMLLKSWKQLTQELAAEKPHHFLGHATVRPRLISDGSAQSVIAARSRLNWERRILPGYQQEKLDEELQRVISAVKNSTGDQKVIGRQIFSRHPNESSDNKLIRKIKQATGDKDYCGMSYWADSALAAQVGVPSILFGPAGHGRSCCRRMGQRW